MLLGWGGWRVSLPRMCSKAEQLVRGFNRRLDLMASLTPSNSMFLGLKVTCPGELGVWRPPTFHLRNPEISQPLPGGKQDLLFLMIQGASWHVWIIKATPKGSSHCSYKHNILSPVSAWNSLQSLLYLLPKVTLSSKDIYVPGLFSKEFFLLLKIYQPNSSSWKLLLQKNLAGATAEDISLQNTAWNETCSYQQTYPL